MAAAAVVLGAVAAAGWVASVMAGFLVALVAVEAALAVALVVVLARVLRAGPAVRVYRRPVPRAALPAPRLAIGPPRESGLLAGQTDPAMREVLRGVSRGLRERYGDGTVEGVVLSESEGRWHGDQQQQQFRQR